MVAKGLVRRKGVVARWGLKEAWSKARPEADKKGLPGRTSKRTSGVGPGGSRSLTPPQLVQIAEDRGYGRGANSSESWPKTSEGSGSAFSASALRLAQPVLV